VCGVKPDIINNGQRPLNFTSTLPQMNDNADDLIDENELLQDEDRRRPDQSQLKVSGCSGEQDLFFLFCLFVGHSFQTRPRTRINRARHAKIVRVDWRRRWQMATRQARQRP
jgi:hypothetical protein